VNGSSPLAHGTDHSRSGRCRFAASAGMITSTIARSWSCSRQK
jgi:hypothetical protein